MNTKEVTKQEGGDHEKSPHFPITNEMVSAVLGGDYAKVLTTFRLGLWNVEKNPELQKILVSMDENTRLIFACKGASEAPIATAKSINFYNIHSEEQRFNVVLWAVGDDSNTTTQTLSLLKNFKLGISRTLDAIDVIIEKYNPKNPHKNDITGKLRGHIIEHVIELLGKNKEGCSNDDICDRVKSILDKDLYGTLSFCKEKPSVLAFFDESIRHEIARYVASFGQGLFCEFQEAFSLDIPKDKEAHKEKFSQLFLMDTLGTNSTKGGNAFGYLGLFGLPGIFPKPPKPGKPSEIDRAHGEYVQSLRGAARDTLVGTNIDNGNYTSSFSQDTYSTIFSEEQLEARTQVFLLAHGIIDVAYGSFDFSREKQNLPEGGQIFATRNYFFGHILNFPQHNLLRQNYNPELLGGFYNTCACLYNRFGKAIFAKIKINKDDEGLFLPENFSILCDFYEAIDKFVYINQLKSNEADVIPRIIKFLSEKKYKISHHEFTESVENIRSTKGSVIPRVLASWECQVITSKFEFASKNFLEQKKLSLPRTFR